MAEQPEARHVRRRCVCVFFFWGGGLYVNKKRQD